MIKSLVNINDISVLDQNGRGDIEVFKRIDFDDSVIGSGGFGSVHRIISIDGVQRTKYVVKIFTDEKNQSHAYETIKKLHVKLKKRQQETGIPIYHDKPELLGLPFTVFKGYDDIEDKNCIAFIMYDLNQLGYNDYGSDTFNSKDFGKLSVTDRIYLAYQLSKTIDFLHDIHFIHSDLSENSLWYHPGRIQLSLIDYDSGYHFDSQEKPSTIGKVGHWIGGKFRDLIGQQKDSSNLTTMERLYEEQWVLASAIFEVVFGVMPFFFLADADDKTKRSYLKDYSWPEVDFHSPYFNTDNSLLYNSFIHTFSQFEKAGLSELLEGFKTVFNKGYSNENRRWAPRKWMILLNSLCEATNNEPSIEFFQSDQTTINRKNEKIHFTFRAKKYNSIYLNDILIPLHQENFTLPVFDSGKVKLKVINDFGFVNDEIKIQASKIKPVIKSFKSSKKIRDSQEPVKLFWETNNAEYVKLSISNEKHHPTGVYEVSPVTKTTYILEAVGFFDQIVRKEIAINIIEPVISFFTWEVNLNKGIDNIDLRWETLNTMKVHISPLVGSQNFKGLAHVGIREQTNFKLVAEGLFSTTIKEVTAHPFPVPVIRQIFAPAPIIDLNTTVNFTLLTIPENLRRINQMHFVNTINFSNLDISALTPYLEIPQFQQENTLLNKFSKEPVTFAHIYNRIKEIIYQKLTL